MKTLTMKIDDDLARELEEIAADGSRSEVIRAAVRQYIASYRIRKRRAEVEAYNRASAEEEPTRELAEADMDEAAQLLDRVETER